MRVHLSAPTKNRMLSFGYATAKLGEQLARLVDLAEDPAEADIQIWMGIPQRDMADSYRHIAPRFVWYTMCEQTRISPRWVGLFNQDAVLVPCAFCERVFRSCGVTAPIRVVHFGVDPSEHPFLDRPGRPTYTFFWQGTSLLTDRKCGCLVEQAFRELDLPDSRLLLKTIPYPGIPFDIRADDVHQIASWATPEQVQALDYEADCFVWPTRAEGFGLLALEKMSTGLPVICTDWSGPADFLRDDVAIPIRDYTMQASIYGAKCGQDAKVSLESLMAKMRWCYENREQAAEIGRAASFYVRHSWTWQNRTLPQLREALAALDIPLKEAA